MIQNLHLAAVFSAVFFGAAVIDQNTTVTLGCAAAVFAATIGSAWWSGRKWQSFLDHQKSLAASVKEQKERLERVEMKVEAHDERFNELSRKIDRLSVSRKFDMDELRSELTNRPGISSESKPSILLVDDDQRDRILFKRGLSSHYNIDEAESLAEAVKKANSKCYDCVVIDLYLPDSPPQESISRFIKEHPTAVCVAFSGTQSEEHINASIASGADSFIAKGHLADAGYLSRMIRLAINRRKIE